MTSELNSLIQKYKKYRENLAQDRRELESQGLKNSNKCKNNKDFDTLWLQVIQDLEELADRQVNENKPKSLKF